MDHFSSSSESSYLARLLGSPAPGAGPEVGRGESEGDPHDLRYPGTTMIGVRWLVLVTCLLAVNYRVEFASPGHIWNNVYVLTQMASNGYVHYRIRSNKGRLGPWFLLLAGQDTVSITTSVLLSGGFASPLFVLYYPLLAWFASVFTSRRFIFLWVTVVSVIYAASCLVVGSGIDLAMHEEKVLFTRITGMYAVVAACNLIAGFERCRKQESLERERELHRQRIDLSQAMHDTTAQSAYMIGLGIETAIEMADEGDGELVDKLKATYTLSQSTMWELRHPIDIGLIFEGRELRQVLKSHAETFSLITSVPTEFVCVGAEPPLSLPTRSRLFSVAHNALTNALRHASATKVVVRLEFGEGWLQMTVADDGIGLPHDFGTRGQGLRNMREDVERMGGVLDLHPGPFGAGTAVTCTIEYEAGSRVSGKVEQYV